MFTELKKQSTVAVERDYISMLFLHFCCCCCHENLFRIKNRLLHVRQRVEIEKKSATERKQSRKRIKRKLLFFFIERETFLSIRKKESEIVGKSHYSISRLQQFENEISEAFVGFSYD
jgi:hypothetical protein